MSADPADVPIMAALIQQWAKGGAMDYPCTGKSARNAAVALYNAGFRMAATPVDDEQNKRLAAIEAAMHRLEGYLVIR